MSVRPTARVAFSWPSFIRYFLPLTAVPRSGSRDSKYLFSSLGAGSSTYNSTRFYHPYFNFNRIGHLLALAHHTLQLWYDGLSLIIKTIPLPTPTKTSSSARCTPSFAKAPTPLYLLNLARKRWTTELTVSLQHCIMMRGFSPVPNSLPPLSCAKFSPSFIAHSFSEVNIFILVRRTMTFSLVRILLFCDHSGPSSPSFPRRA